MTFPWLETRIGESLLAEEARQVARILDAVFGDQLLQVGPWGHADAFRPYARTRRVAVLAAAPEPGVDLACRLDDLPFADHCIDAVLLPHTLDTGQGPHAILREVDRVLRPDGQLIVLGFNPIGWWGLRHLLSRRRFPPGVQHMLAEYRLRDWLRLLDYEVEAATYYHYATPFFRVPSRDRESRHFARLDEREAPPVMPLVSRLPRYRVFAGCYILLAHKQSLTMTRIRPVPVRQPRGLVGGLVNPTTRNAA